MALSTKIDVIDVKVYTFALLETHPALCQMPFGLVHLYVSSKPDNGGVIRRRGTQYLRCTDLKVLLLKK